jgi:hypothetical protein
MHEIGDGSKRGERCQLMPSRDFCAAKPSIAKAKFTIKRGQCAILPGNFSLSEIYRKTAPGLRFDLEAER